MTNPPNVEYVKDANLFIWRPQGVLTEAVVNSILRFVTDQEARHAHPFNRFTDMSAVNASDLSFKYVFHVALYRRLSRAGREPVKSAFFVTDPSAVRAIKLHWMMTDYSPLKVELFQDYKAAAEWLRVPVEMLETPNPSCK